MAYSRKRAYCINDNGNDEGLHGVFCDPPCEEAEDNAEYANYVEFLEREILKSHGEQYHQQALDSDSTGNNCA